MPDSNVDLGLSNYLAGCLSAAEREAFERQIAEDPALRRELALARRICETPLPSVVSGDVEAVWTQVQDRIAPAPPVGRPWRPLIWRVAAVAILSLGAGLVWRTAAPLIAGRSADAAHGREYVAPRGQRASFRLPDGTQVVLGPASRLHSSVAADHGPRNVSLEGEGYFVVKHDDHRPFEVRTASGVARDLGTQFVVSAYSEQDAFTVAVAEGAVSIAASSDARDSLVLKAGDVGRVTLAGRLVADRAVPVRRYFAWTEGRLEFDGTPLVDVVTQLGRWYDLDIQLAAPELRQRRIAASFKDESATEALQIVASIAGLQVAQQGSTVVLRSK